MDAGQINSLVGDYLASVDPKLAKQFLKKSGAAPLAAGLPNLKEMVKVFQENNPQKRKMNGQANGHGPAKKAKKVSLTSLTKDYSPVLYGRITF